MSGWDDVQQSSTPTRSLVDRFLGQEAAVAIYSLTSSSAEDAPRARDFLYALDRLNVATSRARVANLEMEASG